MHCNKTLIYTHSLTSLNETNYNGIPIKSGLKYFAAYKIDNLTDC